MDRHPIETLTSFGKRARDIQDHLFTLYSISLGMKAKTVLEIGVRNGYSTTAFLLAMKETGGTLWSVDIGPCVRAAKRLDEMGLTKHWKFILGSSPQVLRKWKRTIDICFIDGDHSLAGVTADFNYCSRFVRKHGLILMHDSYCPSNVAERGAFGVHLLVSDLRTRRELEVVTLPYCNGLTIIRKL